MARDNNGFAPNKRPNGDTGGSDLPSSDASTNPAYKLGNSVPGDGDILKTGYKDGGKVGGASKSDPPDFA